VRESPLAVLTRHFFTSLFDFGVLSEDGAESLKKVMLGGLSLAIALGLVLTRVYMGKYGALGTASPEVYAQAVVADHAFLIAVSMWLVGAAMALVGQSLFPDETDFRILMVEPLTRAEVFTAKLAALALFAGLIIAGSHLALVPVTTLTLLPAVKTGTFLVTAVTFAACSLAGSLFAALAVVAVHGLLVLLAARSRLLLVSGVVRIALIGGLVLALPLLARLPGTADAFQSGASWLVLAPAAWFAGLARWLLGEPDRGGLAALALGASLAAAAIAVVAYGRLYRRFDRITFHAPAPERAPRLASPLAGWDGADPVRRAVRRFVSLTIRRSLLHQGLVVGVLTAAGSLVLNGLLDANWGASRPDVDARGGLATLVLLAPMTMVFFAVPGIRLALSIPHELRANWVFRMTEDVDGRAEVAEASLRAVLALGVGVPIAILAPLQWWAIGPGAMAVWPVEAAIGWLYAEQLMRRWERVPFTCAYLPGKGFVPQMCVRGFAAFVLFTFASGLMVRGSLRHTGAAVAITVVLGGVAAIRRARRAAHARETDLTFEDQLPNDVTALRLYAD
jgi:hypothetical protein